MTGETTTAGIVRTTARKFLDTVVEGIRTLPDVLDAYGTDATAFDRAVDRIDNLESQCDALVAKLRRDISESLEPTYSTLYLMSGDLVLALGEADVVVSRAERFAKELRAMAPALSPAMLAEMREMAETVVAAVEGFVEAMRTSLAADGESGADALDAATLEVVRKRERACDGYKYDLLERAFDELDTADALVVREVVLRLDGVANAAEDAADRLVSLRSRAV